MSTTQIKNLKRSFHVDESRRSVDEETRTVTFSLSSEKAIEDWPGEYVILDHSEGSVRLDRMKTAAPLLFNHDRNQHLGKIVDARLVDRRLEVVCKFGNSQLAREKFQDVADGILTEVSVSASIYHQKLEESGNGKGETYRADDWEPLEASLVTVPADISVGVNRDENLKPKNKMSTETLTEPKKTEVERKLEPVIEFKTDPKEIEKASKVERERVSAIAELARKYNVDAEVVRDHIDNNKPLDEFQGYVLRENLKAVPVETKAPELGLTRKEREGYSLVRAMRLLADNKPLDGLEGECHNAMTKRLKREAKGFFIPTDVAHLSRDLNVGTAIDGGNTVEEEVLGSSLIELLRNKTMLNALGVRTMSGLQGNVAIPRQDGGATAYWLAETAEVTESSQTFDQVTATPHRLVGDTAYSKTLLAQSTISVEAFVREDLMRVLAIAKDLAGINGSGASGQPLGIMNTAGINTVTFTTAATFAKMVEFETAVATDNADTGTMAYLTTPATRGALKTLSTDTGSGIFVWSGGQVNGYRAEVTNQVPGDRVIFGNFNDAMFFDWDGMDIVVDPYSLKKTGQIEITVQLLTDFNVRHPVSFCVSTDSGAL